MRSLPDPTTNLAWRTLLVAMALTVGALALGARAATPLQAALAAIPWAAALVVTLRYAWQGLHRRRVAAGVLIAAAVVLVATRGALGGAITVGILVSVVLLNGVKAHRRLASSHRAHTFYLSWVVLILLLAIGPAPSSGAAHDFAEAARWALIVFWIGTVLELSLRMRLHFLRLRPKLTIAGVLIGTVPLLILVVFGVLLLWVTLGGSRANRGGDIVTAWLRDFGAHAQAAVPLEERFVWQEELGGASAPAWAGDLVAGLRHEHGAGAPVDTTALADQSDGLWLVHVRAGGPGTGRVDAGRLGPAAMAELARVLRADVKIHGADVDTTRGLNVTFRDDEARASAGALEGTYRERAEGASRWHRDFKFGASILPVLTVADGRLSRGDVLLSVETSLADLKDEFFARRNKFNLAMMLALGVIAFLLLAIEAFAVSFGLRIAGGITSAVKELHRATRRLAADDLTTVIDIPNEDELGDLAASFNDMTVAVTEGREHALARQRLQQEMDTARAIQTRLLPTQEPHLAGFEVTGKSIPSRQVGGDYFDFLARADGSLGVAIGDVSGKGMPAALLMANLQASLQGQVIHPASVDEVVERINDLLVNATDTHMFASFFYGVLDTAGGTFTCANAGHNPPLLVRADGSSEWIEEGGLLLGMMPNVDYPQTAVAFAPGDVLVLYTDGITEAEAPPSAPAAGRDSDDVDPGPMFGEEGLRAVVTQSRHLSAYGIREAILAAVQDHLAGAPAGDDITLVVIKRTAVAARGEIPATAVSSD